MFKSFYKITRFSLLNFSAHFFMRAAKSIRLYFGVKLALTNDTNSKIDGIGAQLQRMVSIIALCNYLGVPFFKEDFVDVSVHPLDPFQNTTSKIEFIKRVNDIFQYKSSSTFVAEKCIEIEAPSLNVYSLLRIIVLGAIKKKPILVKVIEPYAITDFYPDICVALNNCFPNWGVYTTSLEKNFDRDAIYIHFRQGVGGNVVYPGQKISREMPLEYFFSRINQIKILSPHLKKIYIFTDAPKQNLEFSPQYGQKFHWEQSPGFIEGKLYVKGNDLKRSFLSKGFEVEVVSGGDPLEAIAVMSLAVNLITSRSSLSYVAGLFNAYGNVYYPNGFWHPKPSSWH